MFQKLYIGQKSNRSHFSHIQDKLHLNFQKRKNGRLLSNPLGFLFGNESCKTVISIYDNANMSALLIFTITFNDYYDIYLTPFDLEKGRSRCHWHLL